ncbi:MAG TPA: hypothetical protein VHG09_02630 [Longimicrobiales bacterium]|nr:hypothetical protein [Longimicrobiales bacterium]
MTGFQRLTIAAAIALLTPGCMPHVMHGPRIEENGVSGTLSLTLGRNREVGDPSARILPSLYGGLRRSWMASEGDGPAGSVGIQLPLLLAPVLFDANSGVDAVDALLATSYLDIYIQPVRRTEPGWESGIGVLGSTALAGPYVQVGRFGVEQGWYTTQLVTFTIGNDLGEGAIYMPTLVWRHRDIGASTAANFSLGLGVPLTEDAGQTLVIAGVSFELGLRGN